MAAAGVAPEEVDAVLLTHIHSDHVGRNTRLVEVDWVPTFPNARIVVSSLEYFYGLALVAGEGRGIQAARDRAGLGEPVRVPASGTFEDSILPLDAAKVRRIVVDRSEVMPGIRFLSTSGHSIDHASIELTSDGEVAIFAGDVFHHPLEVYEPDLVTTFCEFPAAARRARRSRRWTARQRAVALYSAATSPSPQSAASTGRRKATDGPFAEHAEHCFRSTRGCDAR
nr:MBL fold metallo-hydrolase [Sphingomonas sp. BK580]